MKSVAEVVESQVDNDNSPAQIVVEEEPSVVESPGYLQKFFIFARDALQKGFDVLQMSNGDILLTEVKTITYRYTWNAEKRRFERATSSGRKRRS